MTVSAMPHEPRDPTYDPEYAEELAHAALRAIGVTCARTYWVATMAARAATWRNHSGPDRYVDGVLRLIRREVTRRVIEHRLAGPLDAETRGHLEWRHGQIDFASLHPDDLRPPPGWHVETP